MAVDKNLKEMEEDWIMQNLKLAQLRSVIREICHDIAQRGGDAAKCLEDEVMQ